MTKDDVSSIFFNSLMFCDAFYHMEVISIQLLHSVTCALMIHTCKGDTHVLSDFVLFYKSNPRESYKKSMMRVWWFEIFLLIALILFGLCQDVSCTHPFSGTICKAQYPFFVCRCLSQATVTTTTASNNWERNHFPVAILLRSLSNKDPFLSNWRTPLQMNSFAHILWKKSKQAPFLSKMKPQNSANVHWKMWAHTTTTSPNKLNHIQYRSY